MPATAPGGIPTVSSAAPTMTPYHTSAPATVGYQQVSSGQPPYWNLPQQPVHPSQAASQPSQPVTTPSVPGVTPGVPAFTPTSHFTGLPTPGYYPTAGQVTNPPARGIPSNIKNAIRMIQPFYSDSSSVDKARTFWSALEKATEGLGDDLRLSAFRECLKGKAGEEWWTYSQINDFDTLRTRFHNQFVCQTPLQMIERLKETKLSRGMSAEVWGDLTSGLCDAAQYYDPEMRYQYFLSGLRNRQWRNTLDTSLVNSILQAVAVLLYKNQHLPVEEDADFADELPAKAPNGDLMKQMLTMMQQTQNLRVQQQAQTTAAAPQGGSHQRFCSVPNCSVASSGVYALPLATAPLPATSTRGIRQGPDLYTQDGHIVCGRCHTLGCNRLSCRRNQSACANCRAVGHITAECEHPRMYQRQQQTPTTSQQQSANSTSNARGSGQFYKGPRTYLLCGEADHVVINCPSREPLNQLVQKSAAGPSRMPGASQH